MTSKKIPAILLSLLFKKEEMKETGIIMHLIYYVPGTIKR